MVSLTQPQGIHRAKQITVSRRFPVIANSGETNVGRRYHRCIGGCERLAIGCRVAD
jgi:hypothetical protein